MEANERNFGNKILTSVIRQEFQERIKLRMQAVQHRRSMLSYSKEEYLFTRNLKDRVVKWEASDSRDRLAKKMEKLVSGHLPPTGVFTRGGKERVTCIGTMITEPERKLLEKGPKFVPTQGKLSVNGLRSVESAIEAAVNSLRWKYQKESSTDGEVKGIGREEPIAEDEEVDVGTKLLMEPKIRRLVNPTQRAKQPPKMDVDFESQSGELKANIMQAYRQYRPSKRNVMTQELSAIQTLQVISEERDPRVSLLFWRRAFIS